MTQITWKNIAIPNTTNISGLNSKSNPTDAITKPLSDAIDTLTSAISNDKVQQYQNHKDDILSQAINHAQQQAITTNNPLTGAESLAQALQNNSMFSQNEIANTVNNFIKDPTVSAHIQQTKDNNTSNFIAQNSSQIKKLSDVDNLLSGLNSNDYDIGKIRTTFTRQVNNKRKDIDNQHTEELYNEQQIEYKERQNEHKLKKEQEKIDKFNHSIIATNALKGVPFKDTLSQLTEGTDPVKAKLDYDNTINTINSLNAVQKNKVNDHMAIWQNNYGQVTKEINNKLVDLNRVSDSIDPSIKKYVESITAKNPQGIITNIVKHIQSPWINTFGGNKLLRNLSSIYTNLLKKVPSSKDAQAILIQALSFDAGYSADRPNVDFSKFEENLNNITQQHLKYNLAQNQIADYTKALKNIDTSFKTQAGLETRIAIQAAKNNKDIPVNIPGENDIIKLKNEYNTALDNITKLFPPTNNQNNNSKNNVDNNQNNSLTINALQKMAKNGDKINNPITAMTGKQFYTQEPTILTKVQEWAGQTQNPDSEIPHKGETPIEAALRLKNIGKKSLQTRKNVAKKLRQKYSDFSDKQIANIISNARKQSINTLNKKQQQEKSKDFGLRLDGTPKGNGFLGILKRPDGKVSTELSIGVNFDGKERLIPSLVPTLTKKEINYLLSGKKPTKAIIQKAVRHARKRIAEGKSPFLELNENTK